MGLFNSDSGKLVYIVPQSSYYYVKGTQDQTAAENEELAFFADFDDTLKEKEDSRLILSATEHFEKIETAATSNYPVSTSGSQGDHYRPNGAIISFRGVISESSTTLLQGIGALAGEEQGAVIEAYISKVRETLRMIKDGSGEKAFPLVNIHLPDNNTENNCLITSFKISRDLKVGNGYYVDITAQKLLIADSSFSVVPASDAHQSTTKGSSAAKVKQYDDLTVPNLGSS